MTAMATRIGRSRHADHQAATVATINRLETQTPIAHPHQT